MASELPPYAKQWALQWKQAAPAFQAIRDEELRRLDSSDVSKSDSDFGPKAENAAMPQIYDRYPERHGMVIMQRWFMRQALLARAGSNDRLQQG